ncbi:hypothetical protein HJA76_14800 [Rhizobium bangladeshense]|uniref:hypothetical protein n=1 Tax=Rhizobium bangladeshense TaxID=1138189 RepID=UPI001C82F1E8|nr:hypothetical protein [Rhizobium bangladeshense]MBX4920961.1 hypothetical protein [Rhizobium bangladeshense]
MNELFASFVSPEKVLSRKFRVHAVTGDEMEPSLRGGRDFVLTAPVTAYEGEGLYLVDIGLGIELFRVTNTLGPAGELLLSREKENYPPHRLKRHEFSEAVVGIVVADIRTRDERFLRR